MNDDESSQLQAIASRFDAVIALLSAVRQDLRDMLETGGLTAPIEAIKRADSGFCLFCNKQIKKGRRIRGLHERCYQKVRREINRGEVTEPELIQAGKLLEPGPGGRRQDPEIAKVFADVGKMLAGKAEEKVRKIKSQQ